jgi:phosphoserine phosphatase
MVHVVCLIADPKRIPLNGPAVATLERALGGAARWLAPDEACELPVDDHDRAEIRVPIEAALSPELPHDIVVLPAARRRKGLLVSDMHSTMITG